MSRHSSRNQFRRRFNYILVISTDSCLLSAQRWVTNRSCSARLSRWCVRCYSHIRNITTEIVRIECDKGREFCFAGPQRQRLRRQKSVIWNDPQFDNIKVSNVTRQVKIKKIFAIVAVVFFEKTSDSVRPEAHALNSNE